MQLAQDGVPTRPECFRPSSPGTMAGLNFCIQPYQAACSFWTASPRFWGYAQLGKMLAAVAIFGCVGVFFIAVLAA